jgi:heat shock protein HslJ
MRENGRLRAPAAGTAIELTFTAEGRLGFSAGCNSMSAEVRTSSGRLVVGAITSTEMACESSSQQEKWLIGWMGSGPGWRLDGDELVLDQDGTVIRLLDREAADPDLPLVGTRWWVDAVVTGGTTSSVPTPAAAFITVGQDGTLVGFTGCNEISAPAETRADHLMIGAVTTTRKGCPDGLTAVEHAMLATLQQAVTYRIDGTTLTLLGAEERSLRLTATVR